VKERYFTLRIDEEGTGLRQQFQFVDPKSAEADMNIWCKGVCALLKQIARLEKVRIGVRVVWGDVCGGQMKHVRVLTGALVWGEDWSCMKNKHGFCVTKPAMVFAPLPSLFLSPSIGIEMCPSPDHNL
jgi:hypothetical protein